MEKDLVIKRDGLKLAAKIFLPKKEQFKLVIFSYGFTGSMAKTTNNLLPEIAEKLWPKDIATIRFDFNGHGASEGDLSKMSIYNELEDLNAVLQYALKIKGVSEIDLVGHSQGGVVSSMMAGFYPDKISKLVLLAPAASLVEDAQRGECQGHFYDPDHIPSEVDMGKFKLNGWYFRTAKFINVYDVARAFTNPTLILHGEDDQVVNNYAGVRYRSVMKNSELHLIPAGDHGLYTNRDLVYNYVIDFLTK